MHFATGCHRYTFGAWIKPGPFNFSLIQFSRLHTSNKKWVTSIWLLNFLYHFRKVMMLFLLSIWQGHVRFIVSNKLVMGPFASISFIKRFVQSHAAGAENYWYQSRSDFKSFEIHATVRASVCDTNRFGHWEQYKTSGWQYVSQFCRVADIWIPFRTE